MDTLAKLLELNHLNEQDLKPKEVSNEERINSIEDAIAELAELIVGGYDD